MARGTFVLIAGLALCPMTMLSGFADLIRFEERQPAAVDHGGPCLRDGRVFMIHGCFKIVQRSREGSVGSSRTIWEWPRPSGSPG